MSTRFVTALIIASGAFHAFSACSPKMSAGLCAIVENATDQSAFVQSNFLLRIPEFPLMDPSKHTISELEAYSRYMLDSSLMYLEQMLPVFRQELSTMDLRTLKDTAEIYDVHTAVIGYWPIVRANVRIGDIPALLDLTSVLWLEEYFNADPVTGTGSAFLALDQGGLSTTFPFDTIVKGPFLRIPSRPHPAIYIERYALLFQVGAAAYPTICPLPVKSDFGVESNENFSSFARYPDDTTTLFTGRLCCGGISSCTDSVNANYLNYEYLVGTFGGGKRLYLTVQNMWETDSMLLRFDTASVGGSAVKFGQANPRGSFGAGATSPNAGWYLLNGKKHNAAIQRNGILVGSQKKAIFVQKRH